MTRLTTKKLREMRHGLEPSPLLDARGRAAVTHLHGPFSLAALRMPGGWEPSRCLTCGGEAVAYFHGTPGTWKHAPDCAAYAKEQARARALADLHELGLDLVTEVLLERQNRAGFP